MAGIGFVLRQLSRQENLLGFARSFAHSTFASAGPWLFTVCALSAITTLSIPLTKMIDVDNFRLIIIYNFAFTLVLCSPVLMTQTRFLADSLYIRDVSGSIGLLIGSTMVLFAVQLPLATCFYFFYANLSLFTTLSAIANYMAIIVIWPVAVFLTALKDYTAVSSAFAVGLAIAILLAGYLAPSGVDGVLCGFTVGLIITSSVLIGRVFAEYPFRPKKLFAFLPYFRKHKYVFFTGVTSGIAIWIDKWIMWLFAPEAEQAQNNLITYPNYDSAMFLSYLTIVPSMAAFMLVVETDFFESYRKFFRDIQQKATLGKIEQNHRNIMVDIYRGGRTILLVQISVTLIAVGIAPGLFEALGINFLQLSIFRFGAIGACFQTFANFMIILLSYFNHIKAMFWLYTFFMITNGLFTAILLPLGFPFYGLGFALSNIATFLLAGYTMIRYAADLPYHTFVTSNTSVQ